MKNYSTGLCLVTFLSSSLASAQTVPLGAASTYAVIGGSTVTSTGNTVIDGNLGLSPGTSITGFGPGSVNGVIHAGDAVAATAHANAKTAYGYLAALISTEDMTGVDLGGKTLHPGVYHFNTTAQLTRTLTLDSQGDTHARYVFQIGTGLTTSTNSQVLTINGGHAANVYWQIGTSATIGAASAFQGNLFADQSITLGPAASLYGRVFATNAAVTMINNHITVAAVPEPSIILAMAGGLGALALRRKRR